MKLDLESIAAELARNSGEALEAARDRIRRRTKAAIERDELPDQVRSVRTGRLLP